MAKPTMGTVDKALSLLRHFSVQKPEVGLSELSRLAGYDKTTILRCMNALERNGFVEQNPESKKYRLGLAPISFARIRERSFPLLSILQPHLDNLARVTGETAHATIITGTTLMTALISEPERATRVHLDPSIALPVHATASGLAIAAHLPADLRKRMIEQDAFERFTDQTPDDPAALETMLEQARQNGFTRADQYFEADVIGTAAAFFNASNTPAGALAVAAVATRFNADLSDLITTHLIAAVSDVTRELGGTMPARSTVAA
ncbi:IclR family transcriptional regulator C-terminal domain-containing protein [Pseudosulfitobacter sp. SM2401]|uniref:IclR family transcriptional regulator n=1 Tax=Pseudosulfitobacter sp. SM2401 TaxID=3350098 RepID=UPI0036F21EA5